MPYDPQKHHLKATRLPGYDYASSGAYFVTICVRGCACILGEIVADDVRLNAWGQVAWDCWRSIPEHFAHVELDAFVVMPNHLHGIIVVQHPVGTQHDIEVQHPVGAQRTAPLQGRPRKQVTAGSLGAIVRSYKAAVTKEINQRRETPGALFWQRNYWEHVIRNQAAWDRIRIYIEGNPAGWTGDQLHPGAAPNRFNRALARRAGEKL